jgi:undecaprenyl-diphosphatase
MISNINLSILVISFIITFFVSLITIKLLIRIIKSDKFYLFGIYNIILGIVVLIVS